MERGTVSQATTPNPILEGVELREAYARVREALEKWKCPSCGGAKTYMQRTGQNPGKIIPCKVCQETGLHPTAREALSGLSLPGRDAKTRAWLGDVVAALVAARYQPGDHPIVPTKIAAFIDKAEELLPRVLSALSTVQDGSVREEGWRDIAETIIRDVAELPDRSSPDDWPDAMLVTADELRVIVENAITGAPPLPQSPAPISGDAS